TMPPPIKQLIQRYTNNPAWVKIEAHAQNAPKVAQVYFEVDRRSKVEALTRLIDLHDFRYGIVFCATKNMVDELAEILSSRGYAVDRLHGDITQTVRTRVMEKFRRRGFEFLVATDVAARGLDVDDLEVVFNYDLPNDAEDYTHRVGRTGRAGRTGKAFTFVCGREVYGIQNMIRYARLPLRRERIPSLDQVEEARENVFFEKLRATLDAKQFRPQDRMIDRLLEQGYGTADIASALIHLMNGGQPGSPTVAATDADGLPAPKISRPYDDETIPPRGLPAAPVESRPPVPVAAPSAMKPAVKSATKVAAPKAAEHKPAAKYQVPIAAPISPAPEAPSDESEAGGARSVRATKQKYDRVARTGREPGYTTVYLNIGRKHLVTPADVVGKIAGVTRLPAAVVGAMDIHQRHTLVDVLSENASAIVAKMEGIRVKNVALAPALATDAHRAEAQD
ncbi:MAG: ATP-dependent helicase, partial [Verrucomicrobia bacterium]